MRKIAILAAAALAPALATAQPVQSTPGPSKRGLRFVLGLEGGFRALSAFETTDRHDFRVSTGTAFESVDYKGYKGADFGGSATLWPSKRVGFGVAVTRTSGKSDATITGFRPNTTSPGVTATKDFQYDGNQLGVHGQLHLALLASDSTSWSVYGGPTYYRAEQTVVSDPGSVGFGRGVSTCFIAFPFIICTTTITSYTRVEIDESELETQKRDGSAVGFNAGTELTHYFSDSVGIGLGVRYSTASITMQGIETGSNEFTDLKLKAGGLEAYGGLRFRF